MTASSDLKSSYHEIKKLNIANQKLTCMKISYQDRKKYIRSDDVKLRNLRIYSDEKKYIFDKNWASKFKM